MRRWRARTFQIGPGLGESCSAVHHDHLAVRSDVDWVAGKSRCLLEWRNEACRRCHIRKMCVSIGPPGQEFHGQNRPRWYAQRQVRATGRLTDAPVFHGPAPPWVSEGRFPASDGPAGLIFLRPGGPARPTRWSADSSSASVYSRWTPPQSAGNSEGPVTARFGTARIADTTRPPSPAGSCFSPDPSSRIFRKYPVFQLYATRIEHPNRRTWPGFHSLSFPQKRGKAVYSIAQRRSRSPTPRMRLPCKSRGPPILQESSGRVKLSVIK